jgi:predicted transcriptional regulator
MPDTLTKADMARAIAALPEDATVEDAIERLLMIAAVREGQSQIAKGEFHTQEEVERRMAERFAARHMVDG